MITTTSFCIEYELAVMIGRSLCRNLKGCAIVGRWALVTTTRYAGTGFLLLFAAFGGGSRYFSFVLGWIQNLHHSGLMLMESAPVLLFVHAIPVVKEHGLHELSRHGWIHWLSLLELLQNCGTRFLLILMLVFKSVSEAILGEETNWV